MKKPTYSVRLGKLAFYAKDGDVTFVQREAATWTSRAQARIAANALGGVVVRRA